MKLLESTIKRIKPQNEKFRRLARARLDQLTMPHWAMGRLMDLAVELAGMTSSMKPPVSRKTMIVMAGDHGVTAEGISKYPREVTCQMISNFVNGGAGINALARLNGIKLAIVDMGVAGDLGSLASDGKIISRRIKNGTENMAVGPAMSRAEAIRAVESGIETVNGLLESTDIFGTGDMGIGNTTSSSAIAAVLTGSPVERLTGRGTGLDDDQLELKMHVIKRAIEINSPDPADGLDVLGKVGGFEIGGIAGVIIGAAAAGKPVVIDGFPSTAGALIAMTLSPESADYMIASHMSAEKGHRVMLDRLGKEPYLHLGMRLGEGTGAALAMNLVEAAVRILTDVATFEEASVSRSDK